MSDVSIKREPINVFNSKIHISCNACKRRELDSILIKKYLLLNNYVVVDEPHLANIIIFFTCSFSEETSSDSYKKLNYYQSIYQYVFVCGCFPVIGIHKFNRDNHTYVINNDNLCEIESYFPPRNYSMKEIKDGNDVYIDDIFNDNIFLIRISSGCLGNCSYCAIKKAIGVFRSKTIEKIIEEVNTAFNQKHSHIRLIADDGGAYGIDLNSNIVNLLYKLSAYHQLKGIDIEINPKWILKYKNDLLRFIDQNSKLEFKLSIPIQSASGKVLKHMNRAVDMTELHSFLQYLRTSKKYKIFLTTHIIAGYPEENQEDQNKTIDFITSNLFDQINIFPLTLHPHSPIGNLYRRNDDNIQDRTSYIVNKLCSNGYEIIDCQKSEKQQWQHVILRLMDTI